MAYAYRTIMKRGNRQIDSMEYNYNRWWRKATIWLIDYDTLYEETIGMD